ncbi:hypothetical protein [Allorhizobium terrae]|uniref:Uncharacterized protein n=1 Tax=Allorhizobium terrae TaxID=1848972 RepID=A0A4S4A643_9HYPH|nr:hypothetical protein [Allorhizobium terrae]THF54040.1 hypothetical protein E6C51_02785 [Allorhizobium terrae]
MKTIISALVITAAMILAVQPGHAASTTPEGVCAKEGVVARCDAAKPAQQPIKHSEHVQPKHVKHRGKNIDPITTCSMGKKTPCVPLKK